MSDQMRPGQHLTFRADELSVLAEAIEASLAREEYQHAVELLSRDITASWFALSPNRTIEIIHLLAAKSPDPSPFLKAAIRVFTEDNPGTLDCRSLLAEIRLNDPREMFVLSLMRMSDFRFKGRTREALEQSGEMEKHLGQMQPLLDSYDGWSLHTSVQVGISAMLAGDFTRALTNFTRAQMHVPVPKFAFLTRDALAKSALIHACFGNATTARSLVQRADRIPRTSSWVEAHIDAHRDFADVLVSFESYQEALDRLEAISLHDIGEMWPFYILATQRILEGGGYHDELEHRLEMFDTMSFPRIDGDGFAGSIIPLKRAMIAMKSGRGTEAQELLDRADQSLAYTQLFQAAANIYAGRTQQAIQQVSRLRTETRGFRLMEVRRLSILAAAQYQSDEQGECIDTLNRAAELPRGLTQTEVQLFSPETRELATKHISNWPVDNHGPSAFLTGLPKPGLALTDREVEIIQYLAEGYTRAKMAEAMFISVNTLKTHLKSIYKKLDVSSADDAILGAQRRGLI